MSELTIYDARRHWGHGNQRHLLASHGEALCRTTPSVRPWLTSHFWRLVCFLSLRTMHDRHLLAPPRRLSLGTPGPTNRDHGPSVALVRDPHLTRFLQREFSYLGHPLKLVATVAEISAWSRIEAPRPRMILVSLDEMEAVELCALRRLHEGGWNGALVALSRSGIMPALRAALGITTLLTPPFVQDMFADLLHAAE